VACQVFLKLLLALYASVYFIFSQDGPYKGLVR
jgi:hypothetical protein